MDRMRGLCLRNSEFSQYDEMDGREKTIAKTKLHYKRKHANKKLYIDKAVNDYLKLRQDVDRLYGRIK